MDERPGGVSWEKALSEVGTEDVEMGGDGSLRTSRAGGATTGGAVAEDPDEIRARIEETRAGMSETIDAISERLNPETLREQASEQVELLTDQAKERVEEIADQAKERLKETVHETVQTAKDALYDSTIGKAGHVMQNMGETVSDAAQQVGTKISDAGSTMMTTVRRNPLPVALIGLGLGMLYLRRSDRRSHEEYDGGAYRGYDARMAAGRGQAEGTLGRASRAVGDFAGDAQETVSNTAGQTWGSVSGVAGQARHEVGNLAGQVADRAADIGTQVRQGARQAQTQYRQSLEENPLAVGAVALAAGAAVGLMLPATRAENRLMGETRENLTQMAEEAARTTIGKVQQVAGEAGRAARKEAEYQGLTGS